MNWLSFAVITAILYAFFDFFLKQSSSKIDDRIAGLIVNSFAALVLIIYVFYEKSRGETFSEAKPEGYLFSIIAGVIVGIATITIFKMFTSGGELSTGIVIVRAGSVLLAFILGLFILGESVSIKNILGLVMVLVGLVVMLVK